MRGVEHFPRLDLDSRARFQLGAGFQAQDGIGLAQTEQRVGFLTSDRGEIPVVIFSTEIMRPISRIAEIGGQPGGKLRQIEIRSAHHF